MHRLDLVHWKFASADEEQGATAHRRGVYMEILDESSTGATQLFAAIVEFYNVLVRPSSIRS